MLAFKVKIQSLLLFVYCFGGKSVCRTLLFLCHSFMFLEGCLDTNSEYFQLNHPSPYLSQPSSNLATHPPP